MIMKALSLRQPWAYCVLHLGKRIENRDWTERNGNRRFTGQCLIHASKSATREDREDWEDLIWKGGHVPGFIARPKLMAIPEFGNLERGGIVGIATVIGEALQEEMTETDNNWWAGGFALRLAKVHELPFASCKGHLGFFNVDTTLLGLDDALLGLALTVPVRTKKPASTRLS